MSPQRAKKVVVFTVFNDGVQRHQKALGETAVTITGAQSAEQRMEAVDRFQTDPDIRVRICNITAGGVGITLTAGTHVIFQDLDWVPANANCRSVLFVVNDDRSKERLPGKPATAKTWESDTITDALGWSDTRDARTGTVTGKDGKINDR
jgi:Helicase conserved C-terminal domain